MFGATCTIFRAGAVPGAPGASRGPQGAENRPETRGRIYHFIIPKVRPMAPRRGKQQDTTGHGTRGAAVAACEARARRQSAALALCLGRLVGIIKFNCVLRFFSRCLIRF